MKPISARQIAVVFTGSFLGAGFLSGQELLQFFGVFGGFGLVGMALAILAFVGFSRMVMEIAQETGRTEFDHIIVYRDLRWLRLFVEGVFLFFLFDVMVAMLAGAGALLEQVFGLPAVAGDALISLLVLAVALAGAAGLLASFSLVVPLLVAAAIAIGVAAFCTLSPAPLEMKPLSSGNPLLGNWFFSALSFISYNMMAAVSILVPLTEGTGERKTIHRGLGLGALLLTTPVFWAAWHTWGEIARHVAEDAFAGEVGGLTRVRRFIRTILRAIGWAGLIVYAAILCSGFVSNFLLLAPLVLFALAFGTRHSKRLRAEYNASHHLLSQAFDLNALPPEDPVTLGAILAVHTETFLLSRESAAVGKTLGELNLRGTTGAAVISVTARGGKLNVSPGRDTLLAAGDSLVLVGSDPEIARATALLAQRS